MAKNKYTIKYTDTFIKQFNNKEESYIQEEILKI